MKLKKMFAGVVAAAMMLTMSATAFAEQNDPGTTTTPATYTDMATVTFLKDYKAPNKETNSNVSSPEETFSFSIVNSSVTDAAEGVNTETMPTPTITSVNYAAGDASAAGNKKEITVTLPTTYVSVGVYTYTITENSSAQTAGVEYDSVPLTLTVTVLQQGDDLVRVATVKKAEKKLSNNDDGFVNIYNAGNLDVSKEVTGNLGDRNKYFEFEVTLTGVEGKTYADSYKVSGGSNNDNPNSITIGETATFRLKHGDTIIIENLPYGVTYSVTETASEGYTTEKKGDNGTINAATTTAAFTNSKGTTVDTGIGLDSLPYIMILAMVVVAMVVFFGKKRFARD